MAKKKFDLDFDEFLEYSKKLDELGQNYLRTATDNALTKSKDYANAEIEKAMETSQYHFKNGEGRATGKALASAQTTAKEPVIWEGTTAKAYVGPDLKIAPEAIILALGNPHLKADTKLKNALQVKGKIKKEVSRIQQEEFFKVLKEATNDGEN